MHWPIALGRIRPHSLDLAHNIRTLHDAPKHHMLAVQIGGGRARDEELAAVGVGARVGHGQQEGRVVRVGEGLVGEAAGPFCGVAGAQGEKGVVSDDGYDDDAESIGWSWNVVLWEGG